MWKPDWARMLAQRALAGRRWLLPKGLQQLALRFQVSGWRKFALMSKVAAALASSARSSNRKWCLQAVKPRSYSRTCFLSS